MTSLSAADLERCIPALMERAHVPGLAVAVVRDGELSWTRGLGVRSAATGEPVTLETVFEAASLSKTVSAYAALKLCEAGLLDLDTPMSAYLPWPYIPGDPLLPLVTLRHVLSHSSGLPRWFAEGRPARVYYAPGLRFAYSSLGFDYLQQVLEQVAGRPAAEYLEEHMLAPFGIRAVTWVWPAQRELPIAQGHDAEGRPVEKRAWEMTAAASLHCTAAGFARFMLAAIWGAPGSPCSLPAAVAREMLTPQVQVNDSASWDEDWPQAQFTVDEAVSWGLGWGLQRHGDGRTSCWHWGDSGSYNAFVVGFRDEGAGVVMMANSPNGLRLWEDILAEVAHDSRDWPALEWLRRQYR